MIEYNHDTRRNLCRSMNVEIVDNGSIIFRRGDPSDSFIFVLQGSVNLYEGFNVYHKKFVRNLGPGTSLGELGIIRNENRSLTVSADKD